MINKLIVLTLLSTIGLVAEGLHKIKQDICIFKANENISTFDNIKEKGCIYSFIAQRANSDERGSKKTFVTFLGNINHLT
jgi:hypothetical protein